MTDEAALLRAVLADPADDLARLVFADWLEEHSCPERGEFIRVQVELAGDPGLTEVRRDALRRRERELWFGSVADAILHESGLAAVRFGSQNWETVELMPAGYVRRGFVAEVRAPLAALVGGPCPRCNGGLWLGVFDSPDGRCDRCRGTDHLPTGRAPGHLPALVRREPVEFVEARGKRPSAAGRRWGWYSRPPDADHPEGADDLPPDVWEELTGGVVAPDGGWKLYPSEEAARDALSDALLAWARAADASHPT